MIGLCRINKGKDMMPAPSGFPYSAETVFPLTVRRQYEVFGLGIYNSVLLVLVQADHDLPTWVPAEILDLPPQKIPDGWKFVAIGDHEGTRAQPDKAGWTAIWGFAKLVDGGEALIEGLIERAPDSMAAFYSEVTTCR